MTTRFFLGRLIRLVGRRRLLVGGTLLAAVALGALAVPMPAVLYVATVYPPAGWRPGGSS